MFKHNRIGQLVILSKSVNQYILNIQCVKMTLAHALCIRFFFYLNRELNILNCVLIISCKSDHIINIVDTLVSIVRKHQLIVQIFILQCIFFYCKLIILHHGKGVQRSPNFMTSLPQGVVCRHACKRVSCKMY